MNKYSITIVRQGYIRTNNDLTGNATFEQEFEIEANTQDDAESIAKEEYLGNCFQTYKSSSFDFDWENDSICRDDTYFEIYTNLDELSLDNFKEYLDDYYFNNFILNINELDKNEITNEMLKTYGKEIFEAKLLEDDIWLFIDNKYFLGNVRLTIKELNLNNIRPETYFKKDIQRDVLVNNEFKLNKKELINYLNETVSKSLEYSNDLDR